MKKMKMDPAQETQTVQPVAGFSLLKGSVDNKKAVRGHVTRVQ